MEQKSSGQTVDWAGSRPQAWWSRSTTSRRWAWIISPLSPWTLSSPSMTIISTTLSTRAGQRSVSRRQLLPQIWSTSSMLIVVAAVWLHSQGGGRAGEVLLRWTERWGVSNCEWAFHFWQLSVFVSAVPSCRYFKPSAVQYLDNSEDPNPSMMTELNCFFTSAKMLSGWSVSCSLCQWCAHWSQPGKTVGVKID